MKSAGMKILLVVYVFILAVIIFIANRAGTRYLLDFVGDIPSGDKLGHFVLMGGFSFLLNLSLGAKIVGRGKIGYLLGSLIALVAVALEEVSQIFIAGRTFDWGDLVADFLGIFVFGELARFVCRRKKQS